MTKKFLQIELTIEQHTLLRQASAKTMQPVAALGRKLLLDEAKRVLMPPTLEPIHLDESPFE